MTGTGGNADDKRTPTVDFPHNTDRPAVQFHQLLDQRESDPRTLITASACTSYAVKAFEQMLQLVFRDTSASVAYREFNTITFLCWRDLYLAFECKFESVRKKIENNLFPHLAIDIDRRRKRFAINDKGQSSLLDG